MTKRKFLTENMFWSILESAYFVDGDVGPELAGTTQGASLASFPVGAIREFDEMLKRFATRMDRPDIREAAHEVLGRYCEDPLAEFTGWAISHGKKTFKKALRASGDVIEDVMESRDGCLGWASLFRVPAYAFYRKLTADFYLFVEEELVVCPHVFDILSH